MVNEEIILSGDQDVVVITGSPLNSPFSVQATLHRFSGVLANETSTVNGQQYKLRRYFPFTGVYKMNLVYATALNCGIIDIGLDGGNQTVYAQLDQYSTATTYDVAKASLVYITRGYHDIYITTNGKNASSSGYNWHVQYMSFSLLQEATDQNQEPALINRSSGMVLLGRHIATVAESTFTFNLADILDSKYDEVKVIINGGTTASLDLQAIINGLNTGIRQDGDTAIAGSLTAVGLNGRTTLQIASPAILTGATDFETEIIIKKNSSGIWEHGSTKTTGYGVGREATSYSLGSPASNSLSSVLIQTSTSSWKAGTTINIWGLKKAN